MSAPYRRTIALCAMVLALGVIWQQRFGTVPDTSWIITMCEQVLAGKRLYVDVIETNPPFTLWLYIVPVAAAGQLGLSPELLIGLWTYAAVFIGLGGAAWIAARSGMAERRELAGLAPAFLALLVILPGQTFAQREHLGLALFLPLLALLAWRADQRATRPGTLTAVLAGLSGSVLLLVKPYFAVAVLLPALYVAWRRRSLASLFDPEYWVIGAVCTGYLWAAQTLHPEFLRDVYPLLSDTYMQLRDDAATWASFGLPGALLGYCLYRSWPREEPADLAAVVGLAALGALLTALYQGKGWAYHAYPAVALGMAALLCVWARERHCTGRWPLEAARGPSPLLIGAALIALSAPFLPSQKPPRPLAEAIRAAVHRPSIAVIGTDIALGHPLTRMVDGRWISRFCSDWLGAMAYFLAADASAAGDPETAARYAAVERRYVDGKTAEIAAADPDILIVGKWSSAWSDRLVGHFGYGALLARYRLLAEDDKFTVLIRKEDATPPVDEKGTEPPHPHSAQRIGPAPTGCCGAIAPAPSPAAASG